VKQPTSVHAFLKTQAGQQLLLLLLEQTFSNAVHHINPVEREIITREYGDDLTVDQDLELLLDHLSLVRVVSNLNRHAEESLINYWGSDGGEVFLADSRRYTADALRIAPESHPEQGRAYKNLAYILLARNRANSACEYIQKALTIFQQNGLAEQIEELLEMLSTRTEDECKLTLENVAAVLQKMEVELP